VPIRGKLHILYLPAVGHLPLQGTLAIVGGNRLTCFDGRDLIYLDLAKGLTIYALGEGKDEPFALGSNQFCLIEFDDGCDVLGSLISEQIDCEFEAVTLGLILEDELLVEDEATVI
jgi:hypothetical protein